MIRIFLALFLFLNLGIISQEDPELAKKNSNKVIKQAKDKKKTKTKSAEKTKKNPSEVVEKKTNEYWMSYEFLQNSNYIPGMESKQENTQIVSNPISENKEIKKLPNPPTPKKENAFYTFLNDNKKIIFIILAIIIFAIYRLRFSGGSSKTYNNRYRK